MLRPSQHECVDHGLSHDRCAIWMRMGGGKTYATLRVIDARIFVEDIRRALVIGPLRVARGVWPRECAQWTPHLSCEFVGGEGSTVAKIRACTAQIVTINFEQIAKVVAAYADEPWPFELVIVDEASKLRGFRLNKQGTARAQALSSVAFEAKYFIELTGTPAPSGLINLWGQLWFLDRGLRLGRTMDGFKQRWFAPSWSGYGVDPLPHAMDEIPAKVADICVSIDLAKHFDIKKMIVNDVTVDLPPAVMKQYQQLERKFFTEVAGHTITTFNAAGKSNKLLQLANGMVYDADSNAHWAHDTKLDALEEVIEEAAGMPVLVIYQYVPDCERILKRFPKARLLKTQKDEDDFNDGKIPQLVVHPKSGGHGLSLQHGSNIMAMFGVTWDLELYEQVIERIGPVRQAQSGYDRPVFLHRIVARGTLDFDVLDRLDTRCSVQEALQRAVQRRTK